MAKKTNKKPASYMTRREALRELLIKNKKKENK